MDGVAGSGLAQPGSITAVLMRVVVSADMEFMATGDDEMVTSALWIESRCSGDLAGGDRAAWGLWAQAGDRWAGRNPEPNVPPLANFSCRRRARVENGIHGK